MSIGRIYPDYGTPGNPNLDPYYLSPREEAMMELAERQRRVREAWDRHEDAEPDISTERLLAMVADDTGEDYGDVAALYQGENPSDL